MFNVPRTSLVRPTTITISLEAVIDRLKNQPRVIAVMLLGTTGTAKLTPTSDYDLMVVLDETGYSYKIEITIIDGRTADVIFVAVSCIERLNDASNVLTDDERDVGRWLTSGRIAFDKSDFLARALEVSAEHSNAGQVAMEKTLDIAQHVNYDLRVDKTYAQSDDPTYSLALQLRMLHGFFRVFMSWFELRGLPWEGEKKAIRTLREQDPTFLAVVEAWLAESEPNNRVELEEKAAQIALAPAGGVWPHDKVAQYEGIWERLVAKGL